MSDHPRRGCLYWVAMPPGQGGKRRPALVVSIDVRNRLANDVMVVPASTILRSSPTHVRLRRGQGGIPKATVLKCEQLTTLPRSVLDPTPLGGQLAGSAMVAVEKAILRAIGVPIP